MDTPRYTRRRQYKGIIQVWDSASVRWVDLGDVHPLYTEECSRMMTETNIKPVGCVISNVR